MSKYLQLIRVNHWTKNLLIFLPLIAAKKYEYIYFKNGFIGFAIFSLLASSIYIFNDIIDFNKDKKHPTKKLRPIASGKVSKKTAAFIGTFFLIFSILLGSIYNLLLVIFIYFILNALYSFYLKKIKFIDILTLVLFYEIRIVFGGIILDLEISNYLFTFTFFIFFSLASVKRLNELKKYRFKTNIYEKKNSKTIYNLSLISNLICIISLIEYFKSQKALQIYNDHTLIWLTIPLIIFWTFYISKNAFEGKMNDDPIEFAITNKISLILIILLSIIIVTAQFFNLIILS